IGFAQRHSLKIGTIADLIAYRRRNEHIVERVTDGTFESKHGGQFRLALYRNRFGDGEHIALWKGDLRSPEPVLVRVHAFSLLDDVLADSQSGRGGELQEALKCIGEAGRGVAVLIG